MTQSTHQKLQEKYQHHVESHRDHPGWRAWAILCYRQDLANQIGELINAPNHVSEHFPLERLEKAWLILSGIEE